MSGECNKSPSKGLKEKQAAYSRIKYREKRIQSLKTYLQKGTLPRKMKGSRPIPKMMTPESQKIVTSAYQQAQHVLMEQMVVEEEKKLLKLQERFKFRKQPRKPSIKKVLKDLRELQEKYNQVCQVLETTQQLTNSEVTPTQECQSLEPPLTNIEVNSEVPTQEYYEDTTTTSSS